MPTGTNTVKAFLEEVYYSKVYSGGETGEGAKGDSSLEQPRKLERLRKLEKELEQLNEETQVSNLLKIAQDCGYNYEFGDELWWNTIEELKQEERDDETRQEGFSSSETAAEINMDSFPPTPRIEGMRMIREKAPHLIDREQEPK